MTTVSCVFWNVHNLYPYLPNKTPTKTENWWPASPAEYAQKVSAVVAVLRGMPGGTPDLMAFCEVACPKKVAGLDAVGDVAKALGPAFAHYTGVEGDQRGITCAVVWNTGRLTEDSSARRLVAVQDDVTGGAYGRPILQVEFGASGSPQPFTLLVNHWTSRREENTEGRRMLAGYHLVRLVQSKVVKGGGYTGDPKALVVAVGDFNDEPYDKSLVDPSGRSGRALVSRDRTAVLRRRPATVAPVLYNAGWRLLGERQTRSEEVASGKEKPAGTYLFGEIGEGQWSTFDQVLVSAGMLEGPVPVFDERALEVYCPPQLVGPDGQADMTSDHFPIRFALNF
jgi:endonuclease/exonuclease/phosphatase family metal-dependent hydrolase